MRGLAKMKELDLRLARVTERARSLHKMVSLQVDLEAGKASTNPSQVSRVSAHSPSSLLV